MIAPLLAAVTRRAWVVPVLLSAVVTLVPGQAEAQRDEVLRQIDDLYGRAMQAYDEFELGQAKFQLETAIRMAVTQGISDPSLAKVHFLLGVVVFSETRDATATEEIFVAGLRHDPNARLDPSLSSPELETILENARARIGSAAVGPGQGPGAGGLLVPPTGAAPQLSAQPASGPPELIHRPPGQAYGGVNVPIYVELRNPGDVQRIVLHFQRPDGSWDEVDLVSQAAGGASGFIPAPAVRGAWVRYYIEAVDWSGHVLASAGSKVKPFQVPVVRQTVVPPPPVEVGGARPLVQTPPRRILHLMLGVGTGVGIAQGPPLRKPEIQIHSGIAPSPFHLLAELGVYVTRTVALLAVVRDQLIFEGSSVIQEVMPDVKLRWYFEEARPLRAFMSVGGGWCGFMEDCGYVQHQVSLLPVEDFTDTTREGNSHAGVEGGFSWDFSDHVSLQGSLFLYALFPEKSSVQADLNLGLAFSL